MLSRGDGRASQSVGLKPLDTDLWTVGSGSAHAVEIAAT